MDGVWGSCLQPSQGLFWYRIPDSACSRPNLPRLQRLDRRLLQALPGPPQGHRHAQRGRRRGGLAGARALRQARAGRRVHPGLAAGRPAVSSPDLRPLLVDGAGPRAAAAAAHRHAARRRPGLRVHDEPRRAHRRRPLHHRLLGALLAVGDDLRRRLRPLSAAQGRLGRARSRVDPSLAEADGLHVSRAAGLHQGLEVEGRPAAERLLAPQHVRGVHGGRSRRRSCATDRRRDHAVGQRLPARRVDVAEVAGLPRAACSTACPRRTCARSPRRTPRGCSASS